MRRGEKLCHKYMYIHDRAIPVRFCPLVVFFYKQGQLYYICVLIIAKILKLIYREDVSFTFQRYIDILH